MFIPASLFCLTHLITFVHLIFEQTDNRTVIIQIITQVFRTWLCGID